MTTIVHAAAADEIADVQCLLRASASWHDGGGGTASGHGLGDGTLGTELSDLPGPLAPPRGRLLVAYLSDQLAGSAALREFGEGVCEVTWILVDPRFRGQRVGQALVERLLLEARAAGYRRMRLRIRTHENEALRFRERAGFLRMAEDQTAFDRRVLLEQDLCLAG